jgi:serine/threonine protein kinase
MGRVYLARDEQLRRDVAIKVLHPSKARDPAATRRFLREGRAGEQQSGDGRRKGHVHVHLLELPALSS